MKICHITTVHERYDIRIFHKQCKSLSEEGHEIYLLVNDNKENEKINNINIISIGKPIKNKIRRIFSMSLKKKLLKQAKEINADIYHFHDPELLSLGTKLRKKGYNVVYDVHEDVPRQILEKEWIPKIFRKSISRLFERYENRHSKKYSGIIVPTPHIKQRFKKINNTVSIVANYPSLMDIKYVGDSYSNNNPAVYIGGLSYVRGIIQISEATKKSNIKLNISGKFTSKGLEEEILDKYSHVQYLGFLNREEVSNLLNKSSLGFVTLLGAPNDFHAYPIKLFEYMAAGIPIIASDFPVYKEIVEGNNCGICVDPYDIKMIERAISKLIYNKEYANLLRKNGYKAIVEKYNWESQAMNMISHYKKTLNNTQ